MMRMMAMTAANITMMKLLKPVKPEDHITVACDRQRGSKTARGRERERERERKREREREKERERENRKHNKLTNLCSESWRNFFRSTAHFWMLSPF
jgi:hypothetical protein